MTSSSSASLIGRWEPGSGELTVDSSLVKQDGVTTVC